MKKRAGLQLEPLIVGWHPWGFYAFYGATQRLFCERLISSTKSILDTDVIHISHMEVKIVP